VTHGVDLGARGLIDLRERMAGGLSISFEDSDFAEELQVSNDCWFIGEEVYSFATPTDNDRRIPSFLKRGWQHRDWGGASFLTSSLVSAHYKSNHEVDPSDVSGLAMDVCYILCRAYDGSGWVIWKRL